VTGAACNHVRPGAAPVLPPIAESTFHITEFTSNFRRLHFSPPEILFCIAKIIAYLIEK
jgi:hypothetical protein